ncbi:MAG: hypothetical protein NZ602_07325 [Thermoguttaceae bacterium]|nr:hypothetical protein [Thermoguttaceae bacterium]MDW8038800.1 hypothetical protein [Thermoguttaceae bacterium]
MPIDPSVFFRSSGQRDDRRRLLLCEPTASAQGGSARKRCRRKRAQPISPHYGDASFLERIPRLTDLIPRSLWPYGLALVVGLGIIGGLEWLYAGLMPQLARWISPGAVATFDLAAEGSLAVWFSSTTLLLAAVVSGIVYSVRRYRRDDYQGRYRIWLWAAGCWLLMSVDETAGLHEGFKEMMVLVTGQPLGGDGSLWWAAAYFFLLAGVGVRLLVDMRECPLSCSLFVATGLSYVIAVAVQLEWLFPAAGTQGIMIEEGAEMLGDWLLLMAMALQARHVILDAEGRLVPPGQADSTSLAGQSGSAGLVGEQPGGSAIASGAASTSSLADYSPQGNLLAAGQTGAALASTGTPPTVAPATLSGSVPSWTAGGSVASSVGSAASGTGLASSSVSSASSPQTSSTQSGSTITSPWTGVRRLTEAEKKALRRKLEKLRKQRENQGQNS